MDKASLLNLIYRWRIRANLICLILSLILARPELYFFLAGIGLTLLGLLLRTWASGHLSKEKILAVSGPYKFTRNPLYLANFIIGLGVITAAHSWLVIVLFCLNFLIFYITAVIVERERMRRLFPQQYEKFSREVPLFFPAFRSSLINSQGRFSWKFYKKNREIRTLIAALLFWTLFTLKYLFL